MTGSWSPGGARADRPAAPPGAGAAQATALVALLVGLVLALSLGGCTDAAGSRPGTPEVPAAPVVVPDPTTVRIAALAGPTAMGLAGLLQDADGGAPHQPRHDYRVTVHGTADEVVPGLVRGEVDVALLPANLASVLHHRTRDDAGPQLQVAAVTALGALEVLEAGDTVHSLADLRGRTVHSTGKGTAPEYVLAHLLRSHGLEPGVDVVVEFRSEATEVAAVLASTPGAVGVLPQPYATVLTTQHDVRSALRLADEWTAVDPGSQMVAAVVVVRRAFAQEHPSVLTDLLADVRASITLANADPGRVAPVVADLGLAPSAELAELAIPASRLTYLDGPEMRAALDGYLEVLHAADPASVGGSVPGDDLYLRP